MYHNFQMRGGDETRVELLAWLQAHVGILTSYDASMHFGANDRWKGEGWWMSFSGWYGHFTLCFKEDAEAILFKLSWPNAVQLESTAT